MTGRRTKPADSSAYTHRLWNGTVGSAYVGYHTPFSCKLQGEIEKNATKLDLMDRNGRNLHEKSRFLPAFLAICSFVA
jgi:hypothetical protein